jgi:hypothetical protein
MRMNFMVCRLPGHLVLLEHDYEIFMMGWACSYDKEKRKLTVFWDAVSCSLVEVY